MQQINIDNESIVTGLNNKVDIDLDNSDLLERLSKKVDKLMEENSIIRNTTNEVLAIIGGYSSEETLGFDGAALQLFGKDHVSNPGMFALNATNGADRVFLLGDVSGKLTWDGKEIERVYEKGSKYIKYNSGLLIQWGETSNRSNYTATWVFPQPFKDTKYVISLIGSLDTTWTYDDIPKAGFGLLHATKTTSSCQFRIGQIDTPAHYTLGIGWWK